MGRLSLFQMPFSEFGLKDAVSEALLQEINNTSVNQFSIENSLEAAIKSHIQSGLKNASFNGQCPTCPPNNGLRTKFMLTLQIQINYRVSFKAGLHAGLEFGNNWSSINSSAHLSLYNSGLGTPIYENNKEKPKLVVDATVALNAMVGNERGKGSPMKQYLINYDTPMPVENTYSDWSVGYGQAFTWNSAINNNKFDLKEVQRQGIINVRVGDFSLSTNNDTKRGYFGGGTDHGWTGGLLLSFNVAQFGTFEVGYQNFTGKYDDKADPEKNMDMLDNLEYKKDNPLELSKRDWRKSIRRMKKDLLNEFPYHSQDNLQKSFNRASNFLRVQKDMHSIRLDIESNGWFQNGIHNLINDFKFKYDSPKPIGIWIEKAF
ncbi:polymorphic toxin type 23 domain-containing protein [Capnocytophaga canis]|uniref:polymorphic toxin type 23 domain-containing protein n=1 Tax=Capnocytophaga canis TaxID=1848903 RepID=UPI0037CE019C